MDRSIQRAVCVAGLLLVSVLGPCSAYADGWPLAESASIVCGYAEQYARADGGTSVHTGIDFEAGEDTSIVAVEGGTVSFAGSVPGSAGGTVLAVTIETASGDKWSYMPLKSAAVQVGQTIVGGGALGRLACAGDASTAATHLHVGLRRADRYIDPTPFLAAPVVVPDHPAPAPVQIAAVPEPSLPAAALAVAAAAPAVAQAPVVAAPLATPVHAAGPVCSGESVPVGTPVGAGVTARGESPVTTGSLAAIHDPQLSPETHAGAARSEEGSALSPDTRKPQAFNARAVLILRMAIALACLAPALIVSVRRAIRSRVSALGDTVAAVVSR